MNAPTEEPASHIAEVRQLLMDYEATRPRTMQANLGPSELGTACRRQLAMKIAGVAKKPETAPMWAPQQGTAIHALMEDVLRFDNARMTEPRWLIEEKLHLDDEISGRGDAYDLWTDTVVDWKYTGVTSLRKASRRTLPAKDRISTGYRVQGHLYGWGHERAGRTPKWIRFVYLPRTHNFDDAVEWTEEYKPEVAIWALARFYATRDLVINEDMAAQPERLALVTATATDENCRWCPFHRPGGEVDATGCPGYVSPLDRPVNDWLATLPSTRAAA